MHLPRTGLWTAAFDTLDHARSTDLMAELEGLDYRMVWIPETMGRDGLVNASVLLARSTSMVVGTGIVSIWARDPMAMRASQLTIAEAYPDRFVLGMGVSHQPMVDFVRGHRYDRPLSAMRDYLDAMDKAMYTSPRPVEEPPRVIAALGPKMLQLAADRTDGAHTYLVTPEHTSSARKILGSDPILAVEQMVVLSTDLDAARGIARAALAIYLGLPNYASNLARLGWGADDLANGGSDALVDALVCSGDVDAILGRVRAHLDAGATHVCVQVLSAGGFGPALDEWRELAPALNGLN